MTTEFLDYRVFLDGETLFSEGDRAGEAYLITDGRVRITRETNGAVKELGIREPNTIIGEMGVISDMPRMATATAVGETYCFAISRQIFHNMIGATDIETRSTIHFLVSFLYDAELPLEGMAGDQQTFSKRAMIARRIVDSERTVELLERSDRVFLILCRSLIQRTLEILDTPPD